jgi:hypothetical protein
LSLRCWSRCRCHRHEKSSIFSEDAAAAGLEEFELWEEVRAGPDQIHPARMEEELFQFAGAALMSQSIGRASEQNS